MVLDLAVALTLALALWSLTYYGMTLVFSAGGRPRVETRAPSDREVAVLLPGRNEGVGALRAIESVRRQDHSGPVHICLLLRDRQDSAIPALEARYGDGEAGGWIRRTNGDRVVLFDDGHRRGEVFFAGVDAKAKKLNAMVQRLNSEAVAILDCDHVADVGWLRMSLGLMQERGVPMVQGRRRPLSARGLFALWDSLHQHVGCELFNVAYERLGLSVFCSGTTVVLERSLLLAHPFGDCITEDIDLSYRLFREGTPIVSLSGAGSEEDLSPDFYSFLARRRRWANGHTGAFLHHCRALLQRPGWLQRMQILVNGCHYLVALPVYALHGLIGLWFLMGLPVVAAVASILATLMLAALLVASQRTSGRAQRALEVTVIWGWLLPAVVLLVNGAVAVLLQDYGRLALPLPAWVQVFGLVGMAGPLLLLLVGMLGFGQLGLGSLMAVTLSYPLAFYLDLSGIILGLLDLASGNHRWQPVSRAPLALEKKQSAHVSMDIRQSWSLPSVATAAPQGLGRGMLSPMKPARLIPWALVLVLLVGGVLFGASTRVPLEARVCRVLEQDGHPWIVPADGMGEHDRGWCDPKGESQGRVRTLGSFPLLREDGLAPLDEGFWHPMEHTFDCNLAQFSSEAVRQRNEGGLALALTAEPSGGKPYTAGGIETKRDGVRYLYGRFETDLKVARGGGMLTAFFLYRFDPWQEIDAEFLGKDTTKILINVYYNPGREGDLYNYGYRGTPVLVDLGFDAAEDFHTYAIEWDPDGIRWFVDGVLIHNRPAGWPTPVPHLPMRIYANLWPNCSEELVGVLDPSLLPSTAEIRAVRIHQWKPSVGRRFHKWAQSLASSKEENWRQDAGWMQAPGEAQ